MHMVPAGVPHLKCEACWHAQLSERHSSAPGQGIAAVLRC